MQTLIVGRGYTASWDVTLRDEQGSPVVDLYDGSEDLDLVVEDLEGAALSLSASSVAWNEPDVATVRLTLDEADTALMGPGPRGLSVGVVQNGKRVECYRAALRVLDRPVA